MSTPKQKNQVWRRQLRTWHRQAIKRSLRERQLLLISLEEQLAHLQQCALANGGQEYLDHHNFYQCQGFVQEACRNLYRSICSLGTEHCKQELLACNFPARLAAITDTVQNKTIVREQGQNSKRFYSKLQVVNSVTDLVSLFTEQEELIFGFGEYGVGMLLDAVKYKNPQITREDGSRNLFYGLTNCLTYESLRQATYQELRDNNFEHLFVGYVLRIMKNQIDKAEIQSSIFGLVNKYLKYQQQETNDYCHQSISKVLEQLIMHLFQPQNRIQFDKYDMEFLEEFLQLLVMFQFNNETSLLVLKCTDLYQYLHFVELLNVWAYESAINIQDFTEAQINKLLAMEDVQQTDRHLMAEYIAGSLVNLIFNTANDDHAVELVWRCIDKNLFWEQLLYREQKAFENLRERLHIKPIDTV